MATIDHRNDISIYRRVLNRLPFLLDDSSNETVISEWTYEVMWQLEPCFKVAKQVTPNDENRIGQEQYYNVPKQSLIAELVSLFMLQSLAVARAGAGTLHVVDAGEAQSTLTTTNGGLYVKMAKAGSAETEFAQVKISDSQFFALNSTDLLTQIKSTIGHYASYFNCPMTLDGCNVIFSPLKQGMVKPFIVTGGSDCFGCGC